MCSGYVIQNQMHQPIELGSVPAAPVTNRDSKLRSAVGRGHVRSVSHGGVSLLNPTLQPKSVAPSPAIGFLEAASAARNERSSHDSIAVPSQPKLPQAGMLIFSMFKLLDFGY